MYTFNWDHSEEGAELYWPHNQDIYSTLTSQHVVLFCNVLAYFWYILFYVSLECNLKIFRIGIGLVKKKVWYFYSEFLKFEVALDVLKYIIYLLNVPAVANFKSESHVKFGLFLNNGKLSQMVTWAYLDTLITWNSIILSSSSSISAPRSFSFSLVIPSLRSS